MNVPPRCPTPAPTGCATFLRSRNRPDATERIPRCACATRLSRLFPPFLHVSQFFARPIAGRPFLGCQPFVPPPLLGAYVPQAFVQAIVTVAPKLNPIYRDSIARPMGRTVHWPA